MSSSSSKTLGSSKWHEIAMTGSFSSSEPLHSFVDELNRSYQGFTQLNETYQTLEKLTEKLTKDLEELKA